MTTATAIVAVDASLAVKWVLNEPGSGAAMVLLAQWLQDGTQPIAPTWFVCEATNIFYQRMVRGQLTLEEAHEGLDLILEAVALVPDEPATDGHRALDLADQIAHDATYDTLYTAVAERFDCELWTADDEFWRRVKATQPRVRSLSEMR